MTLKKTKLIRTDDGSFTIKSDLFDDTYHSIHGAVTESKHIFLKQGLQYHFEKNNCDLAILELGFGTGLNALLTYDFGLKNSIAIDYYTLELYPLPYKFAVGLEYDKYIENGKEVLSQFHNTPWDKVHHLHKKFNFRKHRISFELFVPKLKFDLIYHDAFAPTVQEEYWENPFIQQCYDWLNPGGVLISYCAKGSFKRALVEAGFIVEGLDGPPGKREITRAIKA
ncbi:MAG TPA: tRNA (5-methylaminomethyl-2-thiouridine)(34)-methyltransferase MnmD [Saprospiraceae bacterium]|nr:tRNA (5-methylaminomethyl-2-thiouridine)(34)-methyltransferase MnmD [Saprospiraceae bacterium]